MYTTKKTERGTWHLNGANASCHIYKLTCGANWHHYYHLGYREVWNVVCFRTRTTPETYAGDFRTPNGDIAFMHVDILKQSFSSALAAACEWMREND